MSFFNQIIERISGSKTLQQAQAVAVDPEISATVSKLNAALESAGLSIDAVCADEHAISKAIASAVANAEQAMSAQLSAESGKLATVSADLTAAKASLSAYEAIGARLGISPACKPEEIALALEASVASKAAALMANTGMPTPIPDAPETAIKPSKKGDAEIFAEYIAIKDDNKKRKFYEANSEAIWRVGAA